MINLKGANLTRGDLVGEAQASVIGNNLLKTIQGQFRNSKFHNMGSNCHNQLSCRIRNRYILICSINLVASGATTTEGTMGAAGGALGTSRCNSMHQTRWVSQ